MSSPDLQSPLFVSEQMPSPRNQSSLFGCMNLSSRHETLLQLLSTAVSQNNGSLMEAISRRVTDMDQTERQALLEMAKARHGSLPGCLPWLSISQTPPAHQTQNSQPNILAEGCRHTPAPTNPPPVRINLKMAPPSAPSSTKRRATPRSLIVKLKLPPGMAEKQVEGDLPATDHNKAVSKQIEVERTGVRPQSKRASTSPKKATKRKRNQSSTGQVKGARPPKKKTRPDEQRSGTSSKKVDARPNMPITLELGPNSAQVCDKPPSGGPQSSGGSIQNHGSTISKDRPPGPLGQSPVPSGGINTSSNKSQDARRTSLALSERNPSSRDGRGSPTGPSPPNMHPSKAPEQPTAGAMESPPRRSSSKAMSASGTSSGHRGPTVQQPAGPPSNAPEQPGTNATEGSPRQSSSKAFSVSGISSKYRQPTVQQPSRPLSKVSTSATSSHLGSTSGASFRTQSAPLTVTNREGTASSHRSNNSHVPARRERPRAAARKTTACCPAPLARIQVTPTGVGKVARKTAPFDLRPQTKVQVTAPAVEQAQGPAPNGVPTESPSVNNTQSGDGAIIICDSNDDFDVRAGPPAKKTKKNHHRRLPWLTPNNRPNQEVPETTIRPPLQEKPHSLASSNPREPETAGRTVNGEDFTPAPVVPEPSEMLPRSQGGIASRQQLAAMQQELESVRSAHASMQWELRLARATAREREESLDRKRRDQAQQEERLHIQLQENARLMELLNSRPAPDVQLPLLDRRGGVDSGSNHPENDTTVDQPDLRNSPHASSEPCHLEPQNQPDMHSLEARMASLDAALHRQRLLAHPEEQEVPSGGKKPAFVSMDREQLCKAYGHHSSLQPTPAPASQVSQPSRKATFGQRKLYPTLPKPSSPTRSMDSVVDNLRFLQTPKDPQVDPPTNNQTRPPRESIPSSHEIRPHFFDVVL